MEPDENRTNVFWKGDVEQDDLCCIRERYETTGPSDVFQSSEQHQSLLIHAHSRQLFRRRVRRKRSKSALVTCFNYCCCCELNESMRTSETEYRKVLLQSMIVMIAFVCISVISNVPRIVASHDQSNHVNTLTSSTFSNILDDISTSSNSSSNVQIGTTENMLSTSLWVRHFLREISYPTIKNNPYHRPTILLPIPKDYCADKFNLVHLAPVIHSIGLYYYNKEIREDDTLLTNKAKAGRQKYWIFREALHLLVEDDTIELHCHPDTITAGFVYHSIPIYLQKATQALYLLIHQRFILSPRGLEMMYQRFVKSNLPRKVSTETEANECLERIWIHPPFGRCHRQVCRGMPLLPIGDYDDYTGDVELADELNTDLSVLNIHQQRKCMKLYCACCQEVFYDWNVMMIDGCAWGTSFCHLFIMLYGENLFHSWMKKKEHDKNDSICTDSNKNHQQQPPLMPAITLPSIFGFPLHPNTVNHQFC